MSALMTRTRQRLQQILEHTLGALTIVLVLIVLWQVASRYLLKSPSTWTDESSTILLVWMTLIGMAIGFARRAHLGLDYLAEKLPVRQREGLRALVFLVVAAFAGIVLIYGGIGLTVSAFQTGQVMPALQMRRGFFYLPLPISGLLILLVAIEGFLTSVKQARDGKEPDQ